MLVKFDHLTYVVNRKDVAQLVEVFSKKGYHLTLSEEQARNMPAKLVYMQMKDPTHGLHFMAPPREGGIPIEIVSYEHTTKGSTCIDYQTGELSLTIKTKDVESCRAMLLALGCEEKDAATVSFAGALDEYTFEIKIQESNDIADNLDNEGICCPTIFVRPLGKTRTKLEEAGVKCSEIEIFEVQGNIFYMFFAQGNGGEILEITSNKI